MSEKIIQSLSSFPKIYGKSPNLESFYHYIFDKKNNFSAPEIQTYILKNWWSSNFSSFDEYIEENLTQKEKLSFFNILSWDKLIHITDSNNFGNNQEHDDIYRGQNMSWFQFGLLDQWTLVKEASLYVNPKKFSKSINLINSLEENSWHFLARRIKQSIRVDFMVIVEIIQKFSTISVLQKNTMGQTPIDILHANISEQRDSSKTTDSELLKINIQALEALEKIAFYEKLNQTLVTGSVQKTKSHKI